MFRLTRHEQNPILSPDAAYPWEAEGTFNPGVVRMGSETVMLYRAVGEKSAYVSHIGMATSADGVQFSRVSSDPVFGPSTDFDAWGTEDPRITQIDDDFYITYVAVPERIMLNGESFPRTKPLQTATALLRTRDFKIFENLGVISPPGSDNKDIVLFPKKIGGRYCMLHRPNNWNRPHCTLRQEAGHEPNWPCTLEDLPEKPGIWMAWSDDLSTWTDHQVFLNSSHVNDAKIGPGLPPIETPHGWLVIYHHVEELEDKSFKYTTRAALFDLADPTKRLGKLSYDILAPEAPYELEQHSSIVFPTGGYVSGDTLYIYYGASDKYICLATGSLSELLAELQP